jgi:hypothetical protein
MGSSYLEPQASPKNASGWLHPVPNEFRIQSFSEAPNSSWFFQTPFFDESHEIEFMKRKPRISLPMKKPGKVDKLEPQWRSTPWHDLSAIVFMGVADCIHGRPVEVPRAPDRHCA